MASGGLGMNKNALEKLLSSVEFQINDSSERKEFIDRVADALMVQLDNIDTDSKEETLIEYLMAKGLFPTFAFPLDVAVFEAKGTKKKKNNSKFSEPHIYARTSQDLKVALSEYAPGRKIVINKQSFLVKGIGKRFPDHPINHMKSEQLIRKHYDNTGEIIEDAKNWKFYNRCMSENCGVVFQNTEPGFAHDESNTCQACLAAGREPDIQGTRIVKPEVFRPEMIPFRDGRPQEGKKGHSQVNQNDIEMKAKDDDDESGTRTKTTSAKLPTPLNETEASEEEKTMIRDKTGQDCNFASIETFLLGPDNDLYEGTRLLITNNGPHEDGFEVCNNCGYVFSDDKEGAHQRPYAITREDIRTHVKYNEDVSEDEYENRVKELVEESQTICNGSRSQHIVLGHEFRTDVVVFRVHIREPLSTNWNTNAFHSALKAIREALITETTKQLKLVEREISGNYRKVTLPDSGGRLQMFIDFFLYDAASGGAGLVRQITEEKAESIFYAVERRLDGHECINQIPCQRVCTGCLLDFRNQVDQESMNRILGHQMFQYFKSESKPDYRNTGFKSESDPVDSLIESMKTIYSYLEFTNLDENVISVTNTNNSTTRKFIMQSIICGTSDILGDRILWHDTASRVNNLDECIIVIPYELIRDAPHMLAEILYPTPTNPQPSNEFGGGWI